MPLKDLNADTQTSDLVFLLKEVKLISPLIGSYIEYFHFTENIIILKLTNGFIKVEVNILEKYQSGKELLSAKDFLKIGNTFENTLF